MYPFNFSLQKSPSHSNYLEKEHSTKGWCTQVLVLHVGTVTHETNCLAQHHTLCWIWTQTTTGTIETSEQICDITLITSCVLLRDVGLVSCSLSKHEYYILNPKLMHRISYISCNPSSYGTSPLKCQLHNLALFIFKLDMVVLEYSLLLSTASQLIIDIKFDIFKFYGTFSKIGLGTYYHI